MYEDYLYLQDYLEMQLHIVSIQTDDPSFNG